MNTLTVVFLILIGFTAEQTPPPQSPVPADAAPEKVAGGFQFTEGITVDPNNNLFFSDIPAGLIYRITPQGIVSKFMQVDNTNGLQADKDGSIVACESQGDRRLIRIMPNKEILVLADGFDGKPFNSLNDLWIDPKGGVYITDPRYGSRENMFQDGEHVYYVTPDRKVIRVIDDFIRPNGIIGTPNGQTLYVADLASGKTWKYDVELDGTLSGKTLFCSEGSDGMTIDDGGNVYLTVSGLKSVRIYSPSGALLDSIKLPEGPTNVCFGDADRKTLYITARSSIYKIPLLTRGVGSN